MRVSDKHHSGVCYEAFWGTATAAEFQKILDHSSIVSNCWTGALAHLGVARANALEVENLAGSGCPMPPASVRSPPTGFPHPLERRRPQRPHPEGSQGRVNEAASLTRAKKSQLNRRLCFRLGNPLDSVTEASCRRQQVPPVLDR